MNGSFLLRDNLSLGGVLGLDISMQISVSLIPEGVIKAQVSNASAVSNSSAGLGAGENITAHSPIRARASNRKSCGRIVRDKIVIVERPVYSTVRTL